MNQERTRSRENPDWHQKNIPQARQDNQLSLIELLEADQHSEQSSNSHQSTPLDQPLWLWSQHSFWSYCTRGLFWGGIIGFTAISSAIAGVALTRIDAVEQAIANKLPTSLKGRSPKQTVLPRPINVLLLEVRYDAEQMMGFSDTFAGESKTILLLKVKPQQNSAQIINIPPNSRVEIPGFGQGTIKDAYKLGGTQLLSKTINQLHEDFTVDRYIRATPETFRELTASGKITLIDCDSRIQDCDNKWEQIIRQQTTFKTIRQRLNIPGYLASFQTAIAQAEPNLDTNISVPEIISLANFIKELDPDSLRVDLLPGYSPGKTITESNQIAKSPPIKQKSEHAIGISSNKTHPFQYHPIAIQNTTDNPELGRRVVAYLRHRNFRDVYLVEHIPLKLNQTRIMAHGRQVKAVNYLQNILGFGYLEVTSDSLNREITIQIGEDAFYLPTNYRSYQRK